MKKCSSCKQEKQLSEFYKCKRNKTGYKYRCKLCCKISSDNSRKKQPQKYKRLREEYYKNNKDYLDQKAKENRMLNRDKKKAYDKVYRSKNQKRIAQYKKDWTKKQSNNLNYRLKKNLRRRVHHALKGLNKSESTMKLIGCNIDYFIKYIESQFQDGMSWDNYGVNGWHIDHIIPCYKFDLTKPEEQKRCFHYSNQRPLWAKDNLSRSRN